METDKRTLREKEEFCFHPGRRQCLQCNEARKSSRPWWTNRRPLEAARSKKGTQVFLQLDFWWFARRWKRIIRNCSSSKERQPNNMRPYSCTEKNCQRSQKLEKADSIDRTIMLKILLTYDIPPAIGNAIWESCMSTPLLSSWNQKKTLSEKIFQLILSSFKVIH